MTRAFSLSTIEVDPGAAPSQMAAEHVATSGTRATLRKRHICCRAHPWLQAQSRDSMALAHPPNVCESIARPPPVCVLRETHFAPRHAQNGGIVYCSRSARGKRRTAASRESVHSVPCRSPALTAILEIIAACSFNRAALLERPTFGA